MVYFSFSCSNTSYVTDTGFPQGHSWSGLSLHHWNRLMSISTWKVMVLIREQKFHGRCIGTCLRLLKWWLGRRLVEMLMLITLQRRGMIRKLLIFFFIAVTMAVAFQFRARRATMATRLVVMVMVLRALCHVDQSHSQSCAQNANSHYRALTQHWYLDIPLHFASGQLWVMQQLPFFWCGLPGMYTPLLQLIW